MPTCHRVALACAWKAGGELARFERVYSDLIQHYAHIVVSMPPDSDRKTVQHLQAFPHVSAVVTSDWSSGRHAAIEQASTESIDHVHYIDFDRMVR